MKYLKDNSTTIAGNPAWTILYTSSFSGVPGLYEATTYMIKDNKLYTFDYYSDQLKVPETLPIVQKMISSFKLTKSVAQLPPISSSTSPLATKGIEGTRGVGVKAPSLQQIQSTSDSFKNNNNKTLQIISAAVTPIPGGIKQSMTGVVKNASKDTLRFLTITAQILDSKHKVIGTVIAIAKNANLAPGQQTSFSGLGSISEGTKPVYFKLTFDSL